MKKQVIGIFAAMVMCLGIGGFAYNSLDAKADDNDLIDPGEGAETVTLSSDAVTSSVYSYNIINMNGNSMTIPYSELQNVVNSSSMEGLKINNAYGSVIMDKGYIASLLAQTQGDITFSLTVSDNSVYVSAKADTSTIYGDDGICIVEAKYGSGNVYTSVANSSGEPVGTSCYYDSGDVIRWQMENSESYTIATKEVTFNDITNHWSREYVNFLSSRGVVDGVGGGYYEPNGNLTRGQFITILARISQDNLVSYTTENFNDVNPNDYFFNAVCWGTAAGIVNGRTAVAFEPNSKITREEMATMCWRYTDYAGLTLKAVRTQGDFADAGSVSAYAVDAVRQSYAAGYINGKGGNIFEPKGNATRGEAATMIAGLISYITALPH